MKNTLRYVATVLAAIAITSICFSDMIMASQISNDVKLEIYVDEEQITDLEGVTVSPDGLSAILSNETLLSRFVPLEKIGNRVLQDNPSVSLRSNMLYHNYNNTVIRTKDTLTLYFYYSYQAGVKGDDSDEKVYVINGVRVEESEWQKPPLDLGRVL